MIFITRAKRTNLYYLLVISSFLLFFSHAHQLCAQTNCSCMKSLDNLILKVKTEYPGFEVKTRDSIFYQMLVRELQEKSNSTASENCLQILKLYIAFFKDGHMSISSKHASNKTGIVNPGRKINITMKQFRRKISVSKDPMEGVWNSDGYKVGILKQENDYQAFIIAADTSWWKPFEVKFVIHSNDSVTYYRRDHSEMACTLLHVNSFVFQIRGINAIYTREVPEPGLPAEELKKIITELDSSVYTTSLSEKTMLIRISSFGYENVGRIKQMIQKNSGNLSTHPNLIIDLRDNPCGSSEAHFPLHPLIYTNPFREITVEFLSSPTMIGSYRDYLKNNATSVSKEEAEEVNRFIQRLEQNPGSFLKTDENSGTVELEKADTVYANPAHVVVLVNKYCASAAEEFIFLSKQSKKVKVMGTPTLGALDYGAIPAREFDFGCPEYHLDMPTFRSLRLPDYPIDNIGIQPDIYLDTTVRDWVTYAKNYLEN